MFSLCYLNSDLNNDFVNVFKTKQYFNLASKGTSKSRMKYVSKAAWFPQLQHIEGSKSYGLD